MNNVQGVVLKGVLGFRVAVLVNVSHHSWQRLKAVGLTAAAVCYGGSS